MDWNGPEFAPLKSKVNFTVNDFEEKVYSFGTPLIAANAMICRFCFRFSTEIPTAILSSITSLPGRLRPCTSVFILDPGMDGYP